MTTPTLDGDKVNRLKKRFDNFRALADKKEDSASASTKSRIEAWKEKRGKDKDRGMGE